MSKMSTPEQVEKQLAELKIQGDAVCDEKLWTKEFQLKRAIKSEYFRNEVLLELKEFVAEIHEPACETFMFTLKNGKKFTYYCSKEGFVETLKSGKKWRTIVPADKLINLLKTKYE